jgi:hypothetical protein
MGEERSDAEFMKCSESSRRCGASMEPRIGGANELLRTRLVLYIPSSTHERSEGRKARAAVLAGVMILIGHHLSLQDLIVAVTSIGVRECLSMVLNAYSGLESLNAYSAPHHF